jgi:6-pyruvoyltetrahydropterin/6-carboxytetrahydropterin synthase
MYEVAVRDEFSAAHSLRGYKGKCEELHGHNWKVEVSVASEKLDKTGMVIDFRKLKDNLRRALEKLDHSYLNNLSYFKKVNPTSENIARYIYDKLTVNNLQFTVKKVSVWETDKACASYYKK